MSHTFWPPLPLGALPKFIWLERRHKELYEAIKRYRSYAEEYPVTSAQDSLDKWVSELREVEEQLTYLGRKIPVYGT